MIRDESGDADEDSELKELRARISRLHPARRDKLSEWLMAQQLAELSAQLEHSLRTFDYASLGIDP